MFRKTKFEKLFEPLQVGSVRFKNRIVSSPHSLHCEEDGYLNEIVYAYYEAVAKGGAGMIVVGCFYVEAAPTIGILHSRIDDDKFIPGLTELTRVIHKHSCLTFAQLGHPGPAAKSARQAIAGLPRIAPSSLSRDEMPTPSQEGVRGLTIAEIKDFVDMWVKAAERARKGGFDGVEIHCGHSYLLNSFLSRAWNKRQDTYGGDLRNRARFSVEIIRAIKEHLGQDFPVGVRMNGKEWGLENGITSEESQAFGKIFEEAGADYLSVTAIGHGHYTFGIWPEQVLYPEPTKETMSLAKKIKKPGGEITETAAIKKAVSVPVIGVGRLNPELGEWLLRKGKIDLVAFARPLLADPELPNKVASGRLEDIAPCTACLECSSRSGEYEPVRCRINAALGKGHEFEIKPVEKKRRVVVVGGGPAGMEAARVAALRGHEVILYEREHKLGGLTRLAALVKGFEIEDLPTLVRYLETQLTKLGVKVRLGEEVNLALIEEIKPDVVILAPGGVPTVPEIPGINRRNVLRAPDLYHRLKTPLRFFGPRVLRWLTRFWMPLGRRVIIIGGGIQGCQLAEFLVKRGRRVTIVETSDELGAEMTEGRKPKLFRWFTEKGVITLTGVKYGEITDKGLTIITKEGQRQTIEADTILSAMPLQPNTEFFKTLEGKVPEVHLIGDGREPHLILEAIYDGSRIARLI